MNLSYWEKKTWFSNIDFCIVGSGIVGLSCALQLKKSFPKAKVLVLERGVLPIGASTKNAGFACFGSISEILSDLKTHTETEIVELVNQRYRGLKLLRQTLGDEAIGYQNNGGYEVFFKKDESLFNECKANIKYINDLIAPIFKDEVFQVKKDNFNFKNTFQDLILNVYEGQIDVGRMMQNLMQKVQSLGVMILNHTEVKRFESDHNKVTIKLQNFEFDAKKLLIATNAFSKQLLDLDLKPARNQVVITKPIKDFHIKGVFHLDEGYYYFRNVGNRILFGGGRHLDLKGESTIKLDTTPRIQNALEDILYNVILYDNKVEIDQRWSGILGVGTTKKPILKSISQRVHCAVRLGGMGIAIGSELGRSLAFLAKD